MFQTLILGYPFTYRTITRKELKLLQSAYPNELDFEDAIVSTCLISAPNGFDLASSPAGVASTLATKILDDSGMSGAEKQKLLLVEARNRVRTVERTLDLVILAAFPQYTLDAIEDLPSDRYLELFAMAERALIEFGRMAPEELSAIINQTPLPQPRKG